MNTGCNHDHAALCPNIQTIPEAYHILQAQLFRVLENVMLTAATCSGCDGIRENLKFIHEHCKAFVTSVTGIHIQCDQSAFFSHGNTDICRGCFLPPLSDLLCIGGRFLIPVLDPGMLAFGTTDSTLSAGTVSIIFYPVQREHWDSRCSVS